MKRLGLLLLLLTGFVGADDEPKVWVHAPAEDLLDLFPEKGAGFLISIEEYQRLLKLANEHEAVMKEQPPLRGRLVRGTATATIADDVLRIETNYVAVVKGDGPTAIPFPLSNIALETIEVEGGELAGHELRFENPGTFAIKATLSARLQGKELKRAAFRLPPAAAHTLALTLPAEVEGEVGPIVRAFRSGAAGGRVVGYPDEKGLFQLWLKPRSPARKLDALLSARVDTFAEIGESSLLLRTSVGIDVLRAPVEQIELVLAPGQTVRALTGKGVKSWNVTRGAQGDTLRIRLLEPLQQPLALGLETELPREKAETVSVPIVRVPGAVRYGGTVGVAARPEVRVTDLAATGARRLDHAPKGGIALFEVWSQDASLAASVARVAAKTQATTRALLTFREGGKSLFLRIDYTITGQPLFRLEPTLPAGWILRRMRLDGKEAPHRYEPDGRLVMDFPAGLKAGNHVLDVVLDTDEVDWVPNEGAVSFELSGVRSGLDEETGFLVVASDTAFRVTTGITNGLESVGMPEVQQAFGSVSDRMLFAWKFDRPDYAAAFNLERNRPQITATVLTHLLPSERLLKTHASVLLDIQRTGVREMQVSLPKGTGKLVDFKGPLIKERRAPADDADPETWTIVFQKRVRGAYRLDISFDRAFEEDAWSADVAEIVVPGAQERGFVVVHSGGTTAITVERDGLREADVGELPVPPRRSPLEVLAYARHPYSVKITSKRHDPEPVVQAIALSAHIYGVLSHGGELRCRAEYRIRNNDQPFLTFLLPRESSLIGVLVDGEPSKPLVEGGQLKLALPRSKNREAPFVVALVYETEIESLDDEGDVTVNRPLLDIDVLETRYTLHLPRGYRVTGHDGDLVPLSVAERETVLGDLVEWLVVAAAAGDPADEWVAARALDDLEEEFIDEGAGGGGGAGAEYRRGDNGRADKERHRRARKEIEDKSERSTLEEEPEESADEELEDARATAQDIATIAEKKSAPKSKAPARGKAIRGGRAGGDSLKAPSGAVPPGLREPADTEEAPPPPGTEGATTVGRKFVAHGGKPGGTTRPGQPQPGKRQRPERALLSLDVQFLRPDNLVRLDSLAPTGRVTLNYTKTDVFAREHFFGVILGAAAALALLLGRRVSFLRLLPAAVLVVLTLHFAGLSFLPGDLARGAAQSVVVVLLGVAVVRVFQAGGRFVRARRLKKAAVVASLLLVASVAHADKKAPAPPPPKPVAKEILVPYSDDPHKIDRVFLPAKEYHRLRKLAYPETASRGTALTQAEYTATLNGEELMIVARYLIVKETDEAEKIPLGLNEVAVTKATLGDGPANLTVGKGGYVLVLEGKGRFPLELTLRPRLLKKGDARAFRFRVRPVADARLTVTHDRAGSKLDVVGLGARDGDIHRVGPVGLLGATWTPKTEGFRAAAAELRARTDLTASVRDGYTAFAARIRYGISGGTVDRLQVTVGKELTVREVRCPDLAGWQIDGDGNLDVALAKPASQGVVLEIFAERAAKERERTASFPEIAPLGVLRDAGVLALDTLPDLKIEILESQGLLRGRSGDAPKGLTGAPDKGTLQSVHRFALRPFQLRWRVSLARTRLRARTALDLYVEREAVYADARLSVEVERGPGPFAIPVTVPAGYTVETVRGQVRDWWVKDGILTIDRPTRQQGAQTYQVVLRRRGATDEALAAPAIAVRNAVRESGLVRVAVADGLELETGETTNMLPEDIAKVGKVSWGRLVRAYRFVTTPWRLVLNTREEPREMEALVVSRVLPLADRVLVEALVDFNVRRGLVDELSFVVPVAEEGAALINAPDKREVLSEAVDGGRRFTVRLRTPTRGSTSVTVRYSLPYDAPVRGVEPQSVGRVRRYVAVEKVPDGEVRVTDPANLDAGDFEDLPLHPPETTAQTVARVFVGSGGPFTLGLAVKRHSFEEVAKAVIYRAGAQVVVDRSGWTRVLVSYRVYNRSEQFLRLRLPGDALLYSVLVAGEGVRPLAEGGDLLVPLRKLALGSPTFDVDVIYAYSGPRVGDDDFEARLPAVDGLDVRRTTLSLHVPKGFRYSFDTEMEEVEESDIAAGEATDLYEEIKELYGVAQRGNEFQAGRALGNVEQLEQEAQRVMDELRSNTRDLGKLQQIDSQERALDALRRTREGKQVDNTPRLAQVQKDKNVRGAYEWEVNRRFLDGKDAARQQLEQFFNKKNEAIEGRKVPEAQFKALFTTASRYEPPPDVAGALKELTEFRPPNIEGFTQDFDVELAQAAAIGDQVNTIGGISAFEDADGDGLPDKVAPSGLRSASGRISLRIDLPLEGEVYHFAYLGAEGAVTFDADAEGGRLLEGLLAVACAIGVVVLLRRR